MQQLPEQLRQQVELANQHFRELENPAPASADPAPQPATEPTQEEPAKDEPTAPAEPEAQPPAPEEQPNPDPVQDVTYWQHRFQTLQGKYNAEVPMLSAKLREMEAELAKAKEAPPAAPQSPKQAKDAIEQLTDEQLSQFVSDFGPETLAMLEALIQRRVGQTAPAQPDPEITAKLERLEQAEQQREEERQQDAEARFWSALHARIPNLHAVNDDAGFRQWLAAFDPMTGIQRQEALVRAQQALDADRVVAIFNTYLQETGAEPAKKREVPAEQIQPPQSRSTSAPAVEERIWTRNEISQFYTDKTRGKYSREEAERLEADIFAATSSGRVR